MQKCIPPAEAAEVAKQHLELCRWCGGHMIPSPNGGYGIVCEACWWPSGECRCPIRPELVTEQTPSEYVEFRACGHTWFPRNSGFGDGHEHDCGRPFEHNGHHAWSTCAGTVVNSVSPISA